MINKIHILGASGSGTTTLARAISEEFGFDHYDSDDYFWVKTDPPFTQKREVDERVEKLRQDLSQSNSWVLSGSLVGWGDVFIEEFDLVIYLSLPTDLRIKRIKERENLRHGKRITEGQDMYVAHQAFIDWASGYDKGGMGMRSKKLHSEWISQLNCRVLKFEGDIEVAEKIKKVREVMNGKGD